MARRSYPSGVADEEWALVAPYLALPPEAAGQRRHSPRELFDGPRYAVRNGIPWRAMPHDLPPWAAGHQRAARWLRAGCFGAVAADLREVLRVAAGRERRPTAAVLDSRTLRSAPEGGHRAGHDGAKRKRGSKARLAVDTLGHLPALRVTPANADDRAVVGAMAEAVQEATGEGAEPAFVDQGYAGERPAAAVAEHGIAPEVVRLPEAKRGFVLLPRRWVVERSFAWAARFRRLARDYERPADTLRGLHLVASVCLMLRHAADLVTVHNSL